MHGVEKIEAVEFLKTELSGPAFNQLNIEKKNESSEIIECDVCIRSIGYQAEQIDPFINFDRKNHIILNSNGCMISQVFFFKKKFF